MKKYLFIAFLPLMMSFGIIHTFSQEKTDSNLHTRGYLKNSDNEPAAREEVCVQTSSSMVVCTWSQEDGSFTLNVPRAEDHDYYFFSHIGYMGNNERLGLSVPKLQIANLQSSSNLFNSEIRVELRSHFPRKPYKDNGPFDTIKIELCQINTPRLCNLSILVLGGNGFSYEFRTPSSAYSISIKLRNKINSVEWISVDKNNKQSRPLRVTIGARDFPVQVKAGIEEKR